VQYGEAILGDRLAGLQAGNEPDFYSECVELSPVTKLWSSQFVSRNGHRADTYSPQDYSDEFGSLVQAIQGNQNIPIKNNLVGPSVASITWGPEDVWKTGFIENYQDDLFALSVEQYVI